MNEAEAPGWADLADLVEWFGDTPDFHDAEVESIDLRRGSEPSVVRIHVWRTTGDLDENSRFRRDRHVTVSFVLTGVVRQDLTGWNDQNVLFELRLSREDDIYVLNLDASYGVGGEVAATGLRIEMAPHSDAA